MRSLADRPIKKLPALRGRTVVNLFFEDSTRTRISFEAAAKRLSRRRHQLLRQGLVAVARARASRTPRSRSRRWAPTRSSSATAPPVHRTGWRTPAGCGPAWSTPATAPTSTRPRRCSTRSRCGATWRRRRPRRPAGRDRRRRAAQPGGPLQRAAAAHPRRRGHPGRAADAAAGRGRGLAGRDVVRPRRGAAQGRRGDDAAGAAGADERGVLPDRARVLAAATASTAAGWPPSRTTRS